MRDYINAFLGFIQEARSSKTHAMYRSALDAFIRVVGEDAPLVKETYVQFLRGTTDMNPSTQALYRSAIKGLYQFAADSDPGVPTTFFDHVNKRLALKAGKRLPIFNRAGIEAILAYCNTMRNEQAELRDRAFIFLLADSGLRVAEACQLRIGSIDLLECQAVVIGKGNKQAVVRFSTRTAAAVREYLGTRAGATKAEPLFIRHSKKTGDKIVRVKPGDMWHAIKQRAVEAGVEPESVRVHDFRHYFVTIVLATSGNLKLAQELARHERIETTGRYAHLVGDAGKAYNEIFNEEHDV